MNRYIEAHGDVVFLPNADNLGTPMGEERLRAARLERGFGKVWKIGIWIALMAGFFMLGRNTAAQRDPVNTAIDYRVKAARLAVGARACELDMHEGCLVCLHKDASGMPSVSTHC